MGADPSAPRPHFLVTGGAGGIGAAVIDLLVRKRGARCSVLDLTPQQQPDTADVRTFACDVTDSDAVTTAVEQACDWAGEPSGLVAAAGIWRLDDSLAIPVDRWRHIISIHLDGTLLAAQAVARRMIGVGRGGSIVNLCSDAMFVGVPGRAAYGAAKAAIGSLTLTLACEWAQHGIRVNAVAPGNIRTPMWMSLVDQGILSEDYVAKTHPLGRPGEPREVATAIDFLLSDDASFVTGAIMKIDGGVTAKGI